MRKRLYIIFMLIIFLIPIVFYTLSVNADTIIEKAAIDEYVTNYMKRNGLPGASIVIVRGGKLVYEKGYGHDSEGKPFKILYHLADMR